MTLSPGREGPGERKRHVKCDESKPFCQRCLKWQGFCDGYETPSNSEPAAFSGDKADGLDDRRHDDRVTKRKATSRQQVYRQTCREGESVLASWLLIEPTDQTFSDEREWKHFHDWYSTRIDFGGGLFVDDLWERTIPQLSQDHASIRYAVMAIGAMVQTVRQGFTPVSPVQLAASGPEYGLALSYHGKAIRHLRSAATDASSLRANIVCCLLFVCFEILNGDCRAVFAHFDNGQVLMDDILRTFKFAGTTSNPLGEDGLEMDLLYTFQRLIHQSWSCGVLRPPPLDVDGVLENDLRPRAWCCQGGTRHRVGVDKMPKSFNDLESARRWWEATQHYITHWSKLVFPMSQAALGDYFVAECRARVQEHMGKIERFTTFGAVEPDPQLQHFRDALERWHQAFYPLWESAKQFHSRDSKAYAKAAHLRIQYLSLYTSTHAVLSCDLQSILEMTPAFREIVELSEVVVGFQRKQCDGELFTMGTSPTFPLFLAGTRCRDLEVREQAIRVLSENPRRDGMWDSRTFLALAVANRSLELLNAREGSATEQWWRLASRTSYFDEQGSLKVRAVVKNPRSGEWEHGENEIGRFLYIESP